MADKLNKTESLYVDTIASSSIPVSGNSQWHNTGIVAIDWSLYRKVVVRIGSHGATSNSIIIDSDVMRALGSNQIAISSFWNSGNLVTAEVNMNGYFISAKTETFACDYYIYGLR